MEERLDQLYQARQQLEEIQRAAGLGPGRAFGNVAGQATLPRHPPPRWTDNRDRRHPLPGLNPRQQFALHNPRLLDSEYGEEDLIQLGPCEGQPVPEPLPDFAHPDQNRFSLPPHGNPGPLRRPVEPPPQLRYSHGSGLFSPRSMASDSLLDYQASFAQSQPPPVPPKPQLPPGVLRQHFPPPNPLSFGDGYDYDPLRGHKSNSLPRGMSSRRAPRVKWKNDVEGGRGTPLSLLPHHHFAPHDMAHSDSEAGGAYSAPEYSPGARNPYYLPASSYNQFPMMPPAPSWEGGEGPECYSAAEYQNWADTDDPRGRPLRPGDAKLRSSSLPPRNHLADLNLPPNQRFSIPPAYTQPYTFTSQPSTSQAIYANLNYPSQQPPVSAATYARLDVSPLLNRRGGNTLRPVGSGWNADEMQPSTSEANFSLGPTQHSTQPPPNGDVMPYHTGLLTAMTGLLIVHILEGRGLRVQERQKQAAEEVYCVLEVDGEHRARTGVSSCASRFTWNETFEMEVVDVRQMDIYIYSWHPQLRHKLCHRGSLKLMEAFVIDKLNGERRFALTLEPRGQLLIRINFLPLTVVFRRSLALRRSAYFGVDLRSIVEREKSGLEVPLALKRLVDEIERRGLDSPGLYLLCGAAEKKRELRYRLERSPLGCDLSPDTQPDTNVLTSVFRDFLRELPEPPAPPCVFQMLTEGLKVCLPNDNESNARLMLGIVDCLPKIEKCLVLMVMDHLAAVGSQSPHNGMSYAKLGAVFGPLLFCTAQPRLQIPPEIAAAANASGIATRSARLMNVATMRASDFLDVRLSSDVLTALLLLWPGRTNSSGSENSTLNLTQNGVLPLMDVWLAENRLPESDL